MNKKFIPEEYGMMNCSHCIGKGFLIKDFGQIKVFERTICVNCGGFGAVKKEGKVFVNLGNPIDKLGSKGDVK